MIAAKEALIRDSFFAQARACETLGSSFTAALCQMLGERLTADSAIGHIILNWPVASSVKEDAVALRLAGGLHALLLERHDEALKSVYPPHELNKEALWRAVQSAMLSHADFLADRLKLAPQTNEVRRSAMLLPGFLEIARIFEKPLALSEVGASSGLNLNWDRYHYTYGKFQWGDASSKVRMVPEFEGPEIEAAQLEIIARQGCDLNPLDATDPDQQLRMLSYVWADQTDRMERMRNAFDVAASHPPEIIKADAVHWLQERLSHEFAGAVHVIFNTIAWQYLPQEAKLAGEAVINAASKRASAKAPLAWLQIEADDQKGSAAITLQIWPTGEKQEIGRADFHGRWIKWYGFKQA